MSKQMQMDRPLVSLIIISFNEVSTVGDCLNALLLQTYSNYEIIVYDNASSDGTSDFICDHFPQIKLIKGNENLGFGGANNEAAKMARGKYIAFINDDAYVTPGWLEPLVGLLETDSSVGCAGAEILCAEKQDVVLCHGNGIHLSGIAYTLDRGKIASPAPLLEVGSISGAAFLINRTLFLSLGGFESLFFMYYEDIDLSLRLRLLGKRCVVLPGAKVYHNCDSRFGFDKVFYLERNRYLSIFTLMSPLMLCLMFPSMLMFEIFSWGYSILRGRKALLSKAKAWKDIYDNRDWIKERRSKYVPMKVSVAYLLQAFTPYIYFDYVKSDLLLGFVSRVVGYLTAAPIYFLLNLWIWINNNLL
jgi:GT2 family glycosyltransferase